MKNVISYFVIMLILVNCHEAKENLQKTKFSKNVGEKIPNEVAARWAERFKKGRSSTRINDLSSNAETIKSLLQSPGDKLGISFHFATDESGQEHILATVVTDNEPLLSGETIDLAAGTLNSSTAQDWALRYKNDNPNGPWSHFFGVHVFDEMFLTNESNQLSLVRGIDDSGNPQLLIYVWSDGIQSGRAMSAGVSVYDKSIVCPPDCGNSSANSN